MAKYSVDTKSQLFPSDFTKVNVQVSGPSTNSLVLVQNENIQSVPNLSVDLFVASPPANLSAAFSSDETSLDKDNANLNLKSSHGSFSSSKPSNNEFDNRLDKIRKPSLKNGTLKKPVITSKHTNEVDRQQSIISNSQTDMSPLLLPSNSLQKDGTKNNRSNLKLHLNQHNVSKKPKLVIKSIHENPIHSQETDLLLANGNAKLISNSNQSTCDTVDSSSKKYFSKSESEDEDRPVHHVQFHNEKGASNKTAPIKNLCSTPTSSLSSSSNSSTSSDSIDISEARPPDGGWGWVIVAVSFVVNLIADGITFSFGVMFPELLNYFGEDKSKTAWIGSLFMAMPLLSGPIASFLTDRYGCRKVTIVGSLLASIGFIISSYAQSTEVLYFTFGVVAGCGLSLCYVASVVIVAYYFDKKRSFATGLAVCGSGIGTFIFAPLIQSLLKEYGWRGTTLILAGIFLNLGVCGALMRDLPWTSYKNKSAAKERKRQRSLKRKRQNDSSVDTFSVSNSTNTASALQTIPENSESKYFNDGDKQTEQDKFSSLVNLPTYVRNGEKVPMEVLELLSTHKNVYNVLLQNYPNLLAPSRSFSDSGRLHQAHLSAKPPFQPSPLASEIPIVPSPPPASTDAAYLWWLKKNEMTPPRMSQQKKVPTAYFRDLRVHRLSLTYRGAMLNINRYRLRASSCPDIYRNSMTTIAKEKMQWYAGLWDFWDLIVDIIDLSHFANAKYLLFAISNFLLYTWYDVEYMYLTDYALGMDFSEQDASMLISVIGIVNMFGEIILGWAGDRPWINASLVYAICMCCCGAVIAFVPLLTKYWALCFMAGSFGFFIAANYSLTCIILVELITLERFTNAYGLLLLVQGVANLIGPPIAGKISDVMKSYDLSFYLAGLFIAFSGLLLLILPATKTCKRFRVFKKQVSTNSANMDKRPKKRKYYDMLTSCIKKKRNGSSPEEEDV